MQYVITSTPHTKVIHTTQYWEALRQLKWGRKNQESLSLLGLGRNTVISSESKPSKNNMEKTFI